MEVTNPVIVVQVLSPSGAQRDFVIKAAGYAKVATIQHYLVLDPAEACVLHYRRMGDVLAPPEEPSTDTLRLDPPGLSVDLAAVFA